MLLLGELRLHFFTLLKAHIILWLCTQEFQCWMRHLLLLSTWVGYSRSGLQWSALWPAFPSSVSLWGKQISLTVFQSQNNFLKMCNLLVFVWYLNILLIYLSSQWLRGLPTSRQSFNIVFGECPYCSKVTLSHKYSKENNFIKVHNSISIKILLHF